MRFNNWTRPKIRHARPTKYGWTVFHPENFHMGHGVDIGFQSAIFCHETVTIGDGVQIGGGCYIYSLSTIGNKRGAVRIEDGACIGALSVIMPGVTIGKGAIVGAHSFVNKDVPAGAVVMGRPARERMPCRESASS